MTTPTPSASAATGGPDRPPPRLRLVTPAGDGRLDGGWWPRSRDLAVEVADLVDQVPALGRITAVLYSAPDWDGVVDHVQAITGRVEADLLAHADAHRVDLRTTDGTTVRLLVVPPTFTDADGEEALLAASTPGNAHSAGDLLDTVTDADDVDPSGHWRLDGGAGWGPDPARVPRPR